MADKRIDQLTAATSLGDSDLLVVQQSSTAKKATGSVVASYIDGKYGLTTMAGNVSSLQTAIAGKQDALTIPLPVLQGGTGATTAANARVNLGLGPAAVADIDATLSVQDAVADAKAAGDGINNIESTILFDASGSLTWAVGAISSSNGANSTSTTRIRTNSYIPASASFISVESGYQYMLFAYNSGSYVGTWNGTNFVKSGNWRTASLYMKSLPNYDYKIVFADENGTAMSVDYATNIHVMTYTDESLSIAGKSADAKVTGEGITKLANEMFNISNNVTVLSDGTDFDTLLNPAVYRVSNNTHAATMINIPQKTSGKLIVCTTATALKVYQIYATTTSATFMYVRQYDGSAWGAWNRILSSYDLTTINNRLTELEKTIYIKHESGAWANFTELLYVCIPTYDGYILYKLRHYVRQDNNCNCWTIYKAYHVDDNFENEIQLTITAEWECAVHIADRDDFSGGNMHGDEIMQNVSFLVDGVPADITAFTSYTKCGSLKILRNSTLYDPADHTTAIANHGVEYTFNAESGLNISQSIKWLNSYSLTNCFLAMFPPSKAYIDRASFNSDFEIVELASDVSTSQPVITKNNANGVETWDTSSGFSAKFYTPVYPTGLTGGDRMIVSDNGDEDYNKFYAKVCENQSVSANTLWKSESVYILNYKSN